MDNSCRGFLLVFEDDNSFLDVLLFGLFGIRIVERISAHRERNLIFFVSVTVTLQKPTFSGEVKINNNHFHPSRFKTT